MNPVVNLTVNHKGKSIDLNCLLDTGSQLTIFDYDSLNRGLNLPKPNSYKRIHCFNRSSNVKCLNREFNVEVTGGGFMSHHAVVTKDISLNMKVAGVDKFIESVDADYVPLSTNFTRCKFVNESITINGILGSDFISKLPVFELVNLKGYKFVRLTNGYVPIGNLSRNADEELVFPVSPFKAIVPNRPKRRSRKGFRHKKLPDVAKPNSAKCKINKSDSLEVGSGFCRSLSVLSERDISHAVNFVLNPVKTEINSPLDQIFVESHVEQGLENFYSLNNYVENDLDHTVVQKFEESIEYKDGHYYIEVPWKEDLLNRVPSNFVIAKVIAKKVYYKLLNQGISTEYNKVFEEQLNEGIIEEVPCGFDSQQHVWIPHRAVIKDDNLSTTKIRPVFNCSLRTKGFPSLNDAAEDVPDLMSNLLSLLNYFRSNNYILLADIRKAFLQIKFKLLSDKNKFSFIVYDKGKYKFYRYNTVIFGFVSSPFFLNYILKHHAQKLTDATLKDMLSTKFYVDNLITVFSTEKETYEAYKKSGEALLSGGFLLRDFVSNSNVVNARISEQDGCSDLEMTKVLGLGYNVTEDVISVRHVSLNKFAKTKREVASAIASVFDPLGLLCPVLINCKLLLREICKLKVHWDDVLPESILKSWSSFSESFRLMEGKSSVARQAFKSYEPVNFNVFSDASSLSYGYIVYTSQSEVTRFFCAKNKLTPMPPKTLPSLELLAAFEALKCVLSVCEDENLSDISVRSVNLFVDSQISLTWLLTRRGPKKNRFVCNKLKELNDVLDRFKTLNIHIEFHYVPTDHNVADLLTRKISVQSFLKQQQLYLGGPSWLNLPLAERPKGNLGSIPDSFVKDGLVVHPVNDSENMLIDIKKFSSLERLLGIVTSVFVAVHKFKNTYNVESYAVYRRNALMYLIKNEQENYFSDEIAALRGDTKLTDLCISLNLFLDHNEILRSRGRVGKNVALTFEAVNPILLHNESHLTSLVVNDAHHKVKHLSTASTLNYLRREGYWITKGRSAVTKVLSKCVLCKIYNSYACRTGVSPELPSERVNFVNAFDNVGVDYTGHYFIENKIGERCKCYILIFSCLNTRAIHLELLEDMSAPAFVLAFIRFCNRYGIPTNVWSDNAKSFLSSGKILKEMLTDDVTQNQFKKFNVTFRTIPAYAPWYGACWERLIGIVKKCISKTFGRSRLEYESFLTSLSDIQNVVNNRPLTYRSKNQELDILTPNCFLSFRNTLPSIVISENSLAYLDDVGGEMYRTRLFDTLDTRKLLIKTFTQNWYEEYLLSLREMSFGKKNLKASVPIGPNSVVLYKIPDKNRTYCPLVRVLETYENKQGEVFTAKVIKPDKTVIKVPVAHLVPLELDVALECGSLEHKGGKDSNENLNAADGKAFLSSEFENSMGVNATEKVRRSAAAQSEARTKFLARRALI